VGGGGGGGARDNFEVCNLDYQSVLAVFTEKSHSGESSGGHRDFILVISTSYPQITESLHDRVQTGGGCLCLCPPPHIPRSCQPASEAV
jgi:hypothetical protein